VLALIFGLAWLRRARRDDPVRGGFVFWGAWLVTFGLIFSKMSSIPHTAYVASLALPLAALPAAGIMMFWRLYRSGDGRGWVLPLAVGAELAWVLYLWRGYGGFLPWARTAAVVAGVAAVVVMAGVRLISGRRAWVVTAGLAACGVGVAAMLAAPATWAGSVLDARYAGSSMDAGAGPAEGMNRLMGNLGGAVGSGATLAGGQAARVHGMPAAAEAHGPTGVPGMPAGRRTSGFAASLTLSSAGRRIYGYVSAHRDGAGYLMAVQSWSTAAPYILSTGQEVMPIGGFSGTVPQPTLAKVQHLTGTGQLRFFLLNGTGSRMGSAAFMRGSSAQSRAIVTWVQRSCAKVPVRTFGTTAGTLYRCATRAA
jgi:4-amino-4-deoxy-L-arabinose transferase-like glycosyltransferase